MARTARARAPLAAKQGPAPSIAAFTRVSKSHVFSDATAKKVIVSSADLTTTTPSKKRKASSPSGSDACAHYMRRNISFSPSDDEEDENQTTIEHQHDDVAQRNTKRACRRQEPAFTAQSEKTPVKAVVATPTAKGRPGKPVAKTPVSRKQAAHRPSASTIISKSRQVAKAGQARIDAFCTKKQQQAKSAADKDIDAAFPPHLAELVRLHRAFLSSVVMQMAHTRSAVPLDIRELAPNIARSWRKRAVTVEDVRRCVAIESSVQEDGIKSPFIVADYGKGKVCVELRAGNDGTAINEAQLCRQFENNLKMLCTERATDQMVDVDVALEALSLAELPQADLTDMNTSVTTAALLAKGHKALSDLKSDMAAKQQEREAKQKAAAAPLLNADGTKMSLLDRLRHKQLAAANAPLPPTGPELQRRAALNRVVDVASTISMLSLSNPASLPRQAFTMVAIVEKLRDSLRVPMSKEEGVDCIRLIAKEIAPEWLRIVTIGGRENVVIQRGGEPISRAIQERVQRLL
ncbi:hypothetical protein ISF_01994 [Cordyceps fumosorosea ARSEF 2679]|uniref:DNA replication factor Cdt1 C-terminal domain-containing protein n=1 Tax=Cordyceps fumosorosea (strain ARSEF 2679) TaxID=1081104 RepID=A0A168CJ59_CORFA|nr:hypothetical protein ISF_01994 [Cordyceps fumosorosea ARSEF 2679]OAA71443.1 hypothetical protein ISF_01994 [Cordyceps fumosorosea ARSEF 2679]